MNKMIMRGLIAVALTIGMIGVASAGPVTINFDQSGGRSPGGTLSYDGNGGAAYAKGITFNEISGIGTPQNAGAPLSCIDGGCVLTFNTGNNVCEPGQAGCHDNEWIFGVKDSSISLTGTASDGTNNYAVDVEGYFDGSNPTVTYTDLGGRGQFNFSGLGLDTKNAELLSYFGITNPHFSFNHTNFTTDGGNGASSDSFNVKVTAADFQNVEGVPEPGVLGMFGFALLMLGVALRRRGKAE
jgi:hypothetical protein